MAINPNRKLELSPEALAALKLPLMPNLGLLGSDGRWIIQAWTGNITIDCEIATFIAALVNEALTPACEPEKAAA